MYVTLSCVVCHVMAYGDFGAGVWRMLRAQELPHLLSSLLALHEDEDEEETAEEVDMGGVVFGDNVS